jgi:hypothetical protein
VYPDADNSGPPVVECKALSRLAERGQRAAAQDLARGQVVRKPLVSAQLNQDLRRILNGCPLAGESVKLAQKGQNEGVRMGMGKLSGPGECLMAPHPRLARVAETKESRNQESQCHRAMVDRVEGGRRTVRKGIVELDHPLQMPTR